jgi:hypothetical protein
MKAMHRLIVMSATYRMGSRPSAPVGSAVASDLEKRWFGRFSASRMEAEEVRDGVLHVSGTLDPAMFGADIDHTLGMTSRRRSLYFTHQGESRMAFLELFDAADACDAYRRTASIVPQQALAIVNNAMLIELSARLADRLWSDLSSEVAGTLRVPSSTSVNTQVAGTLRVPSSASLNTNDVIGDRQDTLEVGFIDAAFEQVLCRRATPAEKNVCRQFLRKQAGILGSSAASASSKNADARARADLVHALFSHNDFVTIH